MFDGGRCSGWELEELITNAIKSDTTAQHHPLWREAGHDDKEDIHVNAGGKQYKIQVKSGQKQGNYLVLSGHRLGRFGGDLIQISDYLNSRSADILSLPYRKVDGGTGRQHIYQLCHISAGTLKGICADQWIKKGKVHEAENQARVLFSLRPSMSWQIW